MTTQAYQRNKSGPFFRILNYKNSVQTITSYLTTDF